MNKEWVDRNVKYLYKIIGPCQYLNPHQVYSEYAGSLSSLQKANKVITDHLGIKVDIDVAFVSGLKEPGKIQMSSREEVIGGMVVRRYVDLHVKVSSQWQNNEQVMGAILTHENSHAYLFLKKVQPLPETLENEMFTDLTAVMLGLGDLLLNGVVTEEYQTTMHLHRNIITFGYLGQHLIKYAMEKKEEIYKQLAPEYRKVIYSKWISAKLVGPKLEIPISDRRVIGRADFKDYLREKDLETISRKHLTIKKMGVKFFIEDGFAGRPSTNGTKLNGKEIKEQKEVYDEDKITLGDTITVRFQLVKI